jgi:hypothetical protein
VKGHLADEFRFIFCCAVKPETKIECNIHLLSFLIYDRVHEVIGFINFNDLRFLHPRVSADPPLIDKSRDQVGSYLSASKTKLVRLSAFKSTPPKPSPTGKGKAGKGKAAKSAKPITTKSSASKSSAAKPIAAKRGASESSESPHIKPPVIRHSASAIYKPDPYTAQLFFNNYFDEATTKKFPSWKYLYENMYRPFCKREKVSYSCYVVSYNNVIILLVLF